MTVGLIVGGGGLFYAMMYIGEKLVQKQIEKEKLLERTKEILSFNGHINSVLNLGEWSIVRKCTNQFNCQMFSFNLVFTMYFKDCRV